MRQYSAPVHVVLDVHVALKGRLLLHMGKLVVLQVAGNVVLGGVVVADDLDLAVGLPHQLEQLLAVLPVPRLCKDPHPHGEGVGPNPSPLVNNVFDGHSNIGDGPGVNKVNENCLDLHLASSAMPPGLSLTVTLKVTKRPSAAMPGEKHVNVSKYHKIASTTALKTAAKQGGVNVTATESRDHP